MTLDMTLTELRQYRLCHCDCAEGVGLEDLTGICIDVPSSAASSPTPASLTSTSIGPASTACRMLSALVTSSAMIRSRLEGGSASSLRRRAAGSAIRFACQGGREDEGAALQQWPFLACPGGQKPPPWEGRSCGSITTEPAGVYTAQPVRPTRSNRVKAVRMSL